MRVGQARLSVNCSSRRSLILSPGRHVRCALVKDGLQELLPVLLDVVLVAAKPDWWTMTDWERCSDALGQPTCAYQKSGLLIPVGQVRRCRASEGPLSERRWEPLAPHR